MSLSACASRGDPSCRDAVDTKICIQHCAKFKTCDACAAEPACGFCAAEPGSQGRCMPALHGLEHREEAPSTCTLKWFYRQGEPCDAPGAPCCPPAASPGR